MTNPTAQPRHRRAAHRRADDRSRSELHTALDDWARFAADSRRARRATATRRADRAGVR
jgi:hypothetical protein